MKYIFPLVVLLSLAACAPDRTIEFTDNYEQGNYIIQEIQIVPASEEIAQDVEYQTFAKEIVPYLQKRLGVRNQGKPLKLAIRVNHVSLEINALTSVLVGDDYKVFSMIALHTLDKNHAINQPKAVDVMLGAGTGRFGIIGYATEEAAYSEKDRTRELYAKYADELMAILYPPEEE